MRCAKCHENGATVQFTPVVDGKPKKPIHLCKQCADSGRLRYEAAKRRRKKP